MPERFIQVLLNAFNLDIDEASDNRDSSMLQVMMPGEHRKVFFQVFLWFSLHSTGLLGGNRVDGLPPDRHLTEKVNILFKISNGPGWRLLHSSLPAEMLKNICGIVQSLRRLQRRSIIRI